MTFLNDQYLLSTPLAQELYETYAKNAPIIDYHCHLDPQTIYENKPFKDLTDIWLSGDHYKWRLMRANGIPESHITGNASNYEKFLAWAETVPKIIGNPLYVWTHLELKRYFQIHTLLTPNTAQEIWEEANQELKNLLPRTILTSFNIDTLCTTDDPVDSLEYHQKLRKEEMLTQVLPAFRPDKAMQIEAPEFTIWLAKLESSTNSKIQNFDQFLTALSTRVHYFHKNGSRLSDHALDTLVFKDGTKAQAASIFNRALEKQELSSDDLAIYRTVTLTHLVEQYDRYNWTMQLHINAQRNNNLKLLETLGPDSGFDSIGDRKLAQNLAAFLNHLEQKDILPQTILYSLNPNDYPVLATIIGSFQKDSLAKLQLGSAWWFNDTRSGIRKQLTTLAENSILHHFVGMLTDSRSFLSYPRHEYFRRILCDLIGEWHSRGEVPDDFELLGNMVKAISYNNAANYFDFNV